MAAPSTTSAFLYLSSSLFKQSDGTKNYPGDDRCPGAIPLISFGHSVVQQGSEYAGRPRSVESIMHNDFTVTRAADTRSPQLFRLVARAEFVAEANILVFAEYPRQSKPYLIYSLTCVHVSTYAVAFAAGAVPVETIGLKYGNIRIIGRGDNLPTVFGNVPGGYCDEGFSQVMNIPKAIPALGGSAGKAVGDSDP